MNISGVLLQNKSRPQKAIFSKILFVLHIKKRCHPGVVGPYWALALVFLQGSPETLVFFFLLALQ